MKKTLIIATGLCCSLNAFADLPHTFTAGSPAKASEVNANFTDLESKICSEARGALTPSESNLTYTAQTAAIGSIITVGGTDYRMIAYSFIEPSTGDTYKVKFPSEEPNDFGGTELQLKHVKSNSVCTSNTSISGHPSFIYVEQLKFINFSELEYQIETDSEAEVLITIDEIMIEIHLDRDTYSAMPNYNADYDIEADGDIYISSEITALDSLIDYISVEKIVP